MTAIASSGSRSIECSPAIDGPAGSTFSNRTYRPLDIALLADHSATPNGASRAVREAFVGCGDAAGIWAPTPGHGAVAARPHTRGSGGVLVARRHAAPTCVELHAGRRPP